MMVFRNVEEKKRAATHLKAARDFLESVIENSMDGIMICDEKGHILSINRASEKMCSFTKEELVGEHASTLIIEDDSMRQYIGEKSRELFEKGFSSHVATYKSKGGQYVDVECNTSMIRDDSGDYIAGVSIVRNISERKKMEHQLVQTEKLRSLGELAGGVAHDFNNVLAAILGRVQLLKNDISCPVTREKPNSTQSLTRGLAIIEKAALDGAETVRRIQEFSRTRTDDKEFTQVDVNELLEDALEFTRTGWKDDVQRKGTTIDIEKVFAPSAPVTGSPSELREVFTNIIKNAVDAMPDGGTITIGSRAENNHVLVSIQDTGTGIPEPIRDKIFEPFFTTKGPQSTGLGMSVSYGIISRHGGTIRVDSAEGEGTTFTTILPRSDRVSYHKKVDPPTREVPKVAVLVIEDQEAVRELLFDILAEAGHDVEAASNGTEGMERFEAKQFDLVFTDLGMPGMSGWQVAEEVKKIHPDTPVALITGWNPPRPGPELSKSGIDFVLAKPFQSDQVLRVVEESVRLGAGSGAEGTHKAKVIQ
jgi:PAS domain S-box-containing protein